MKLNKKNAVVLTGLLGAATIAGTVAYYSGFTQTEENRFTIVAGEKNQSGAGTIEEPSWNPDDATDLQPNATVPKDPSIMSNLEYDAWAFIKVEMPTVSAQVEGDSADKVYDAFDYIYNSNDWVLISTENSGKSDTAGTDSVYIYAYKTPLTAGSQTSTLFDEMTVPDYTKLRNGLEGSVDLTGYLIQTEGFATYTDAAKELGFEGITDPGGEEEPDQPVLEGETMLREGYDIRNSMLTLAGYLDINYDNNYDKIKSFKRSQSKPNEEITTQNIASSDQPEVLIWFDESDGTIYYYTEAGKVYMNSHVSDLFNGFGGITSIDLSELDTSNVTTMEYMFNECYSLTEIKGIENIDTKNVESLEGTFSNCKALTELDLSNWNVEKVTTTHNLFEDCELLKTINLTNWNTMSLTDASNMFYNCSALTTISGIEQLNTLNVKDISRMFYNCNDLETLNLSNWNVNNVTDFTYLFYRCYNLTNETINTLNNWNINSSATFHQLFKYCKNVDEGGRVDFPFPAWSGIWDDNGTFTPTT